MGKHGSQYLYPEQYHLFGAIILNDYKFIARFVGVGTNT